MWRLACERLMHRFQFLKTFVINSQRFPEFRRRLLILALPVLFCWFFLSSLVLVPVGVGINALWVEPGFAKIGALVSMDENRKGVIRTSLFTSDRNIRNNSYEPELTVNGSTNIPLGSLSGTTTGLAVFVMLSLASRLPAPLMVAGTGMLLVVSWLLIGLTMYTAITTPMVENAGSIYSVNAGFVTRPDIPDAELLNGLKGLQELLVYGCAVVVPVACWWWLDAADGAEQKHD